MPSKASKKRPELKIIFDTNVIFNGSSSELLKEEVETIIKENSDHKDLDIIWCLPKMVVLERQYQMIRKGLELLPSIEKLEKLLGHKLAIAEDTIISRVEEALSQQITNLLIKVIELDSTSVDWHSLILNSASRKPPFDPGEKEKGFRDSIILETFLQIVESSPTTPRICRVILVTGDGILSEAAEMRTKDKTNVRILSTLEDLKSLINTLVAEIDEEFVKKIQVIATSFFFEKDHNESLYYSHKIRDLITEQYNNELSLFPSDADTRENGTWYISNPRFLQKNRQRVNWASRISIESKAIKQTSNPPTNVDLINQLLGNPSLSSKSIAQKLLSTSEKNIQEKIIAKGKTKFDVEWSVSVSTKQKFSKPKIDSIKFIETVWE